MKQKNELHQELIGITGLNSFMSHNSSSRAVMFGQHMGATVTPINPEEKMIQSGLEKELGKYTHSVKMPEDGKIINVIERYPKGISEASLDFNPETIVIYEIESSKKIDYFSLPYYLSNHQFFGFEYKDTSNLDKIYVKSFIKKGTIFKDSPTIGEHGNYNYGVNLNTAFMSMPSTAEDGFIVSETMLNKFKFKVYENRTVSFGSKKFPLNLYGSADNYKPFQDIGEFISDSRSDGLLMTLRDYDTLLTPSTMSIFDCKEPDFIFDKSVYVRVGVGRIIDIKVTGNDKNTRNLPVEMTKQINKYRNAYINFCNQVLDTYEKIKYDNKKKFGDNQLQITPKFHAFIVECLSIISPYKKDIKQPINLLHKQVPLDEYRIEFVVEYTVLPYYGDKYADVHGGKGVICSVLPDSHMPVDKEGNVADIIIDPTTTVSRMNIGRLHEHYINGVSRDISKRIRKIVNIEEGKSTIDLLYNCPEEIINNAYEYLMSYFKIISENQYEFYGSLNTDEILELINGVINTGLLTLIPPSNPKPNVEIIKQLEKTFSPTYSNVSFIGKSGKKRISKKNVRIAPLYFIAIDKIADGWSSVSSGKLQHFGILSPITKLEKFGFPHRNSPVKVIGETEGRIFVGYCGPKAIAEMLDRSNNPLTQRNMIWNILTAEKPTVIENSVDRDRIPLGGSKPLQLVKHMLFVSGFEVKYEPEDI